uniref:Uncharacterized protein n=1 Tax=Siphoviridae sp. ctnpt50 TaxID=2827941 RepID=A0A8S5SE76_9CAUD|nr:MAG TPA: hypothetical protein [Siphoviridae sp. ctnpt50]
MERRILAELFVNDEKAIEEDLGTIDYVEREAGWMSESGIRVGDMRILDDDDPEDAKASDLADKIFKSEENNRTFVYVVRTDSIIDGSIDTTMKVFSTREKAKTYFDKCVADEKANDHLMLLDDKVINEGEYYFSIYQEGFWSEDRYEIEIIERVVH